MNTARPGPKLHRLLWLSLRFGLVGAGSILVYIAVLVALRPLFESTLVLTATSYVASAAFNYTLQSAFTFRTRVADLRSTWRYIVMHGVCMAMNSLLMFGLVDQLGYGIAHSQVATTTVVAVTSFIFSYLWVYVPRVES